MEEKIFLKLDKIIHQKARLGVMSILATGGEADFGYLKKQLGLSDGNLSTHLSILEKARYVEIKKMFVKKKPRTIARLTEKGRKAFLDHMDVLEKIIETIPGKGEEPEKRR
ncbi:MAG: transcriptional regulator [Candidatus Aminicenantes bacterium]|nr:transcriptional regulator [Candidatus Aminicenantes bacterium]